MKVVLDTNVILAGFGTHGLCEAVLAVCLNQHNIVISQAILSEVRRQLSRKFKMSAARIQEIVRFLQENAEIVTPLEVPADACRDPGDRPVLGTVVAAQAECLITGDKDLLSLGSFRQIPILSPRQFYERVR